MPLIELDYLTQDLHKPLGAQVGAITREIYLCDIWLAGIHYERVSDCEILVTEQDLTRLILFHSSPDIHVYLVNT